MTSKNKRNAKLRICFVAQFPPPMHGLSKAVDTLYHSRLSESFDLTSIDIKNNRRFPMTILRLLFCRTDLFYFTISQSKGGNLRDLIILWLIRLRRKPCVVHLHGGHYRTLVDTQLPRWQRNANYRAVRRLAAVIVLSPSLRPIFEGMLPDDRIYTVPNCIDDEFLPPADTIKDKIGTLSERPIRRVLYLSNFIREKGYREVLKLALMEKERCESTGERKFRFDFAGKFFDEEEKTFFESFVRNNALESYVVYHGVVGGDEKRRLLASCDYFILLTRYPNEGQPISMLEAMGNGMFILSTDHAGIPDIVRDGEGAILLPAGEVCAGIPGLYTSLCTLDPSDGMRRNAETVRDRFVCERYVRDMEAVFRNTLTKG